MTADFVSQRVCDFCCVLPGGLDSACDEEEEGEDDLNRRLKSAVDEASQFGQKSVAITHLLIVEDTEHHPKGTIDCWCKWVEYEEGEDF